MGITDILNKNGTSIEYHKLISELSKQIIDMNIDNQKDIHNIKSVIDGTAFKNRSKGIGYEDTKRLLTIQNPEGLNGKELTITKGWSIEYMGRDLSLTEDNYRWDVYSMYSNKRGYYIIERELYKGDWVFVRWGLTPVNVKERREVIDKKRLRDKSRIQADMIGVINSINQS